MCAMHRGLISQNILVVHGFDVWDFWWDRSSILVNEPGFGRVRSSVFPDLGLGSTHFWLNRFEFWTFLEAF